MVARLRCKMRTITSFQAECCLASGQDSNVHPAQQEPHDPDAQHSTVPIAYLCQLCKLNMFETQCLRPKLVTQQEEMQSCCAGHAQGQTAAFTCSWLVDMWRSNKDRLLCEHFSVVSTTSLNALLAMLVVEATQEQTWRNWFPHTGRP